MEFLIPPGTGSQVIWSLITFAVLLFLLGRFVYPPIIGMLDKRSEAIRESLEAAERTRIDAQGLLEQYKEQMADARTEAQKVIGQSREVGEQMKKEIVEKANEEARGLIERAQQEIGAEKERAVADLRKSVADLSIGVASKIIGEQLSAEKHLDLIERSLSEVTQSSES